MSDNYIESFKRMFLDKHGNLILQNFYLGKRCHGRMVPINIFPPILDGTNTKPMLNINVFIDEIENGKNE